MLSTFISYKTISANLTRSLERTAAEPSVKQQTDYYLKHIGEVKTVDEFLKNDRLYRYAMKAFGLGDMTYAKGMIRKMLNQGIDNPADIANRMSDPRFKDFVRVFNFARDGEATTSAEAVRGGVVDRFVRQTLEETAGLDNDGVRLALYFQRKAPGIASAYSILADPALLKVVQVALNISPVTQMADVDRQAKMLDAKLDVADLKDPKKLDKFLQRFASLYDLNTSSGAVGSISPAAAVLTGQTFTTFSPELLLTIQNLKR